MKCSMSAHGSTAAAAAAACDKMLLWTVVVGVLSLVDHINAGRAFPVESENFVVDLFHELNSNLEWDPTNFLVDLSGHYALCRHLHDTGIIHIHRRTPIGEEIGGLRDSFPGVYSDAWSVNEYLQEMLPFWVIRPDFMEQISVAERFGCSVQPRCKNKIVVACLFTPKAGRRPRPTRPPPPPTLPPTPRPTPPPTPPPITGEQMALAFTPEEYSLTEAVFNLKWDRSHFLENLSGFETKCGMISSNRWNFDTSKAMASQRGILIQGKYGSARNTGSTTEAMLDVLENWDQDIQDLISSGRLSSTFGGSNLAPLNGVPDRRVQLGCSVIPDCFLRRDMYVVVSCLFQVNY